MNLKHFCCVVYWASLSSSCRRATVTAGSAARSAILSAENFKIFAGGKRDGRSLRR
ncbi:hypothetical protein L228DRAFT_36102 [Xylona heveae TC161]|uniref:Uncharacterized protein n=1 Tax=Xylona heveae (strain CBS 132557 / TC161) TaxID=1328760 RepID=A0A164ZUS1_XYLHT|nr:hypothetical protein L228DRAFT_36102 [Xylona heveae TC161]KZF19555.1 hypothetical protein L228DRAFT_36102 [Xylona heveae TC161]